MTYEQNQYLDLMHLSREAGIRQDWPEAALAYRVARLFWQGLTQPHRNQIKSVLRHRDPGGGSDARERHDDLLTP